MGDPLFPSAPAGDSKWIDRLLDDLALFLLVSSGIILGAFIVTKKFTPILLKRCVDHLKFARRMRHSKDPRVPFSDHTYGIAVDIDPGQNRAFSRKKYPDRPKPFEDGWEQYSSIPRSVVEIWEDLGWDWGGRWKNYCDPMHFSLRKLGK